MADIVEKRPLGKTGIELTKLSFGASSLGAEFRSVDLNDALRCVRRSDACIQEIDHNKEDGSQFFCRQRS